MSFRTTSLLFGLLLLILFAFGLTLSYQRRGLDPGYVLPTLARDGSGDIDTVETARGGTKVVFIRAADGSWNMRVGDQKETYRANDKVKTLIDDLRTLR